MAKRGSREETAPKIAMAQEPNAVEQAVARAVRDNLERIQKTTEELHHAMNDVVSACASNKPTNALPPMLRAQTAAASLGAALEVLSKFIATSLHSGQKTALEAQITDLIGKVAPEAPAAPPRPQPAQVPVPKAAQVRVAPPPAIDPVEDEPIETAFELPPEPEAETFELVEPAQAAVAVESVVETGFDVNRLSPEEQELHRRANRVAKVSMQDIKMLRPEAVRLGRENKDICIRLKDDIEKAHREYDRRFKPIMDHPVDYFYRWMVEILAEGDAHALGEYPYATAARQR
jgi:hypothetical protein